MRSIFWAAMAIAAAGCTKSSPPSQPAAAPPSLNSALNFGEKKGEQIKELLSEAEKISCAQQPLLDIYACQVSYYSEHGTYFDSLEKSSCLPASEQCREWSYSVGIERQGNEFTALASHGKSGEVWAINQAKVIEKQPPAPAPVSH